jgi:hypothetical protein
MLFFFFAMILKELVNKGVSPNQNRNNNRRDHCSPEQEHTVRIADQGKDECTAIKSKQKKNADDGENASDCFHSGKTSKERSFVMVGSVHRIESKRQSELFLAIRIVACEQVPLTFAIIQCVTSDWQQDGAVL